VLRSAGWYSTSLSANQLTDDYDFFDAVLGVERELLRGLVVGGEDLDHQLGRRGVRAPAGDVEQCGVGDSIVVLRSEVDPGQRGQAGCARERAEQLGELLLNAHVRLARTGNHVQHTLPDLVAAVRAGSAATLEQLLELDGRGV